MPTQAPAPTAAPVEPTKAPEPQHRHQPLRRPPNLPRLPRPLKPLLPLAATGLTVGQVTDLGGIDDKSFNATAGRVSRTPRRKLGATGKYLESQQQADYAKNIQQFVSEKLDLIVTVGFLLGVDTAKAAASEPEPEVRHRGLCLSGLLSGAVVGKDCGSDKELPNVLGLTFATDQAAFLAGYVAAGDDARRARSARSVG